MKNAMDEMRRLEAMRVYEQMCFGQGASMVAGVDEVGRGPLAGPVLACALILPEDCLIVGVDDSKKLSPKKREALSAVIKEKALAIGIGVVDCAEIDKINILNATHLAMKKALDSLKIRPDYVLIDGYAVPLIGERQIPIIKGDSKSMTVAAASIVAKVERDAMMVDYHKLFPVYGFDKHKGYGTKAHIEAIKQFGLCGIHRRSFINSGWLYENHE